MRKQNTRPNQNARKQMQDLTAELFAGASLDKKGSRKEPVHAPPPPPPPQRLPQTIPPPPPPTPSSQPVVPQEELPTSTLVFESPPAQVVEESVIVVEESTQPEEPLVEVEVEQEQEQEQEQEEVEDEPTEEIPSDCQDDDDIPGPSSVPSSTLSNMMDALTSQPIPTPMDPSSTSLVPVPVPLPVQMLPTSISLPTLQQQSSFEENANPFALMTQPFDMPTENDEEECSSSAWSERWENGNMGNETGTYNTRTETSYAMNRNVSPFESARKQPDKMPNPFANRKRFPMDNFESKNARLYSDQKTFCDDFSNINIKYGNNPASASQNANRRNENNNFMLPAWWKTRSFSSASCYYPQNVKTQLQTRSLTTMNVPSHGNLDDIDNYLTTTYQHNKKMDMVAKKERWARMKAKKRILRRPVEEEFFEDADEEEEIMCGRGVMLNQIVQLNGSGQYEDADLLRKYRRDVAYIKEQLTKEVEGNIDGIREIRFLIASVQTYGNIDGQCMMAEFAMNEFTLFSGVLERFHAIVGPWSTENETQRRRASRQAFDTHKIPLQHDFATVSKRKLVEEILGRSEPSIAYRQGVKVGLYSDTCDEQFRVHLHLKNGFKDASMMVDSNDRRFILVLQSEVELMVESMKHLAKTSGLHYEGFPTTPDRFVIVEAFVDAVVDLIGDKIGPETMHWFGLLGQKNQPDTATPWEKNVDLHCSRHTEPKNNYCAQLTVCRATFIILHILGSFFRRYHLRKIPASSAVSTTTIPSVITR